LRRIERRMVLAGVDDSGRYLDMLRQDPGELELLAKDLLINATQRPLTFANGTYRRR
jgi:two-component system CheB/CheR fusion protein